MHVGDACDIACDIAVWVGDVCDTAMCVGDMWHSCVCR